MVRIRLARRGRTHKPFYHIVIADARSPRDGSFIEKIGYYDPINKENLSIDLDRIKHWVSQGAQASRVVLRLVKKIESSAGQGN